jgi:hypothetical protein
MRNQLREIELHVHAGFRSAETLTIQPGMQR